MPAEGLPWLPRAEVLTYEEITRLVQVAASIGIEQVRLTGGEPTVRKDLPELVRMLHGVEGLRSLSLTTNGILLPRLAGPLAEAGLTRINVSLDSLIRERFAQLTRRDALQQVLDGLAALEQYPTIRPIKINAVAMRGVTEPEVLAFAELSRTRGYVVRWIEFMPLDADQIWRKEDILTGGEIKALIEERLGPLVRVTTGDRSETARRYTFSDGLGEVGFINPVSEPFCASCDRIRLTADGQVRTCLFALQEYDFRKLMRGGGSDDDIESLLRAAVLRKQPGHLISQPGFVQPERGMSAIGG
jgi:cyclic pyranopterin phosphate synthase